jgi:hypothetical protein
MKITLTLPETVAERLGRQAEHLNVSLDDLALILFNDALMIGSAATALPASEHNNKLNGGLSSLEELVARIKATPPNPDAIVQPTKTIAEVVAYWQANPPDESDISPDDWDHMWAEFEHNLKTIIASRY